MSFGLFNEKTGYEMWGEIKPQMPNFQFLRYNLAGAQSDTVLKAGQRLRRRRRTVRLACPGKGGLALLPN